MIARRILQVRYPVFLKSTRTYLSENYKCLSEWESRLQSPLLQKIKLDTFYYEIDQTFSHHGLASAIDIDLFVNKINDNSHNEEVMYLLDRLRKTSETSNALDSTGHAVIRNLVDNSQYDELIKILESPLIYGVFLDHYIANYIMDDLIKKKNFKVAARIATFLMLQEDFGSDLTKSLTLYSCYKYLSNPEPFYVDEEKKEEDSSEVIKVRVKYLRNKYFDDHFDLRDNKHLVGKTLLMLGIELGNTIGKNLELLGYILHEKYNKALNLLQSLPKENIYSDVLDKCDKFLNEALKIQSNHSDECNKVKESINEILLTKNYNQDDFDNEIQKFLVKSITENEINLIENQKKLYKSWNELREKRFNEEVNRLNREERIKNIDNIMKEMEVEEQKLWFFENEEKVNLQIDSKKVFYPKRWFGKKKKPRVIDEQYVPPEITKQRTT